MTLLAARHENPETAALSVASNRASKIDALRAEVMREVAKGTTKTDAYARRLERIASDNSASLRRDIADWLGKTAAGKRASDQTIAQLFKIGNR